MDHQTELASLLLNHISSPCQLTIFLLVPVIFILIRYIRSKFAEKQRRPVPPGPKPWPLFGNIVHLMLQRNSKPHIFFSHLARIHGPLISLRLGTQVLVVGSSPAAAIEILKTNDPLLSTRYISKSSTFDAHILDRIALVWASKCTDEWRNMRALCRNELFSNRAISSQTGLRERKVAEMVEFLRSKDGEVVNVGEIVFNTIFNILSNLLFSKDLLCLEDKVGMVNGDGGGLRLKNLIGKMMELGTAPNAADFYPILAPLDPQSIKRRMTKCFHQMFSIWEVHIKERRQSQQHDTSSSNPDFLHVFLANGFDDHKINWLIMELFTAGTETTTTAIEWAMSELLKNNGAFSRLESEIEREIKNDDKLQESLVANLPYLNATVKETFRLHPPAPFLLPRRAPKTCQVMNYTIPKDSQILINVWAIGRDPSVWEDPLSFNPDRFLGKSMDYKGQDYELLPFGAGRRICPGIPMAIRQLHLILASLVRYFDWSMPDGQDFTELDMDDKIGLTLQKKQPLLLIPHRKL